MKKIKASKTPSRSIVRQTHDMTSTNNAANLDTAVTNRHRYFVYNIEHAFCVSWSWCQIKFFSRKSEKKSFHFLVKCPLPCFWSMEIRFSIPLHLFAVTAGLSICQWALSQFQNVTKKVIFAIWRRLKNNEGRRPYGQHFKLHSHGNVNWISIPSSSVNAATSQSLSLNLFFRQR